MLSNERLIELGFKGFPWNDEEYNFTEWILPVNKTNDTRIVITNTYLATTGEHEKQTCEIVIEKNESTVNIANIDELRTLIKYLSPAYTPPQPLFWTDLRVMEFAHWFCDIYKLGEQYKFENLEVIQSFKNGDKPEVWHHR